MSIRLKLIGAVALMLVLLMVNSFLLISVSQDSSRAFNEIEVSSESIEKEILPLIGLMQDIRVHVIQVQQWLTDISATRGLNGLNDGFDQAATHADAFNERIAKALDLSQKIGLNDLNQILHGMVEHFPPYYETGRKMATAYVAEGPAGGNSMMGSFDAVATEIQNDLVKAAKAMDQVILAKMESNEAILNAGKAENNRSRNIAFVPMVISLLLGIAVVVVVLGICRNIKQMTDTMSHLANGDLDAEVNGLSRTDELGEMATAVQVFKENAIENRRMVEEQDAAKEEARIQLRDALYGIADDLENRFVGSMTEINDVLDGLENTATQMSSAADQTTAQSEAVSAATQEATANVEAVATSGSQLSASISEISKQVGQSSAISQEAVAEAQRTTQTVASLAAEVSKIESVVSLINDIAEQTNMLALNATIEAARAGDAGKGFAVVASEVKNLAQQTSQATEEINQQIKAIQDRTTGAVGAIDAIEKTIATLNDYASAIAAAVEEQSAATGEIAHNVEEASRGTQDVAHNIYGVAQAASLTGQLAGDVSSAAHTVKGASHTLHKTVQEFLADIRDGSSGAVRY